jgi:hypothetical protein
MSDIFKDMQTKVGCDYISDLPSYKRKVWQEMKRLNPADYEERQLEDFSKYVFGMSYQTLQDVMKQQKGREEQCRKQGCWWKRKEQLALPIDVAEFEEKLGVGAESGDYRIIEKVLPFADEVHEHTSVYQLNELDFMYRQLSSDMQEEYVSLLTVYENLEALYICRNVITVYPDCKSMIDVARQKLMNDPTFKHLSEDCQEYYFDFEAYASHLQEHGKFLVTEHGIFELPE